MTTPVHPLLAHFTRFLPLDAAHAGGGDFLGCGRRPHARYPAGLVGPGVARVMSVISLLVSRIDAGLDRVEPGKRAEVLRVRRRLARGACSSGW